MLTVTQDRFLLHLLQLVLGLQTETLGLAAVLMVTLEDAVLHLLCSLVVVDIVVRLKAVNAGVTGVVVDWLLLQLGPETKLTF